MGKRDEIIKTLESSHTKMRAQLDEVDKNRKIYPLWTIREIVAHLSGWDDATIGFVSALLKGEMPPTPAQRGANVYNDETVSTREGLSYDHIVREYIETRAKLVALLGQVTDQMVMQKSILPWGEEGSLDNMVQMFGSHEAEHADDVQKIIQGNP